MKRSLLAIAVVAVAGLAHSQIAFSNLAPDDTYESGIGSTLGGPAGLNFRQAYQFESAATGFLEEIRFAYGYVSGEESFVIAIRDDAAGEPGTVLSSHGFSGFDAPFGTNDIITLSGLQTVFGLNVVLTSGSDYWWEFYTTSTVDDTWYAMNHNDEGISQKHRYSTDGTDSWTTFSDASTAPAYEVSVTPVPEPATMVALGLGAAALIRRRKK